MGYFEGLSFYLLLVALIAIALVFGNLERPLGGLGLLASLVVGILVFRKSPWEAFYLALYLVLSLGLVFGYAALRRRFGRKAWIYRVALVLAILPLAVYKVSAAFGGSLFGFVGISYLAFRVIGMVIDLYDGVMERVDFWSTLSFFVFFPSFSSGPIDRSVRFDKDFHRRLSRKEYQELCATGFLYLLWGAVYKFVLAALFFKAMGYLDTEEAVWYHWILYAYAYSLYLFFDFAGYSRMAVGTAYCFGISLPDNFRAPFLAIDIRDFWDRWHITLSHWFRDYVFTRVVMAATKKKWFQNRLQRACFGFFIDMGIMGLWHGLTASYIVYGLYHGALLAGTEVYQRKSAFYKRNKGKRWYRLLSWAVTMQLVVFGLFLFSGKLLG